MKSARIFLHCFLALSLVACAPIAALREKKVAVVTVVSGDVRLVRAEECLVEAGKCEGRDGMRALELSLEAVQGAGMVLERDGGDKEAVRVYNSALGRVFGILRKQEIDPWSRPLVVGKFTLGQRREGKRGSDVSLYEMIPADGLEIGGKYFKTRARREGVGASLVSVRREVKKDFKKTFGSGERTYYGRTAVARFTGNRCEVAFYDPLDVERVSLGGRSLALAADFTAPYAVLLKRERPEKEGLARLLDPGKYEHTARIARLRPYDRERIPLLLVHGLMDTHATWVPMLNALRESAEIRRRYQIWIFTYPSGYPYPYSAALLRAELDKLREVYPDHKPIVYVGHSMGGMIGRLMLTDSGEALWKNSFSRSPEKIRLPAKDLKMMKEMLIFDHRAEIGRAIFICAPHRGADMAAGIVGRIGTLLVKTPRKLLDVGGTLKHALTFDKAGSQMKRIPSSIDTLSSKNKFVKAVDGLPLTGAIPYHTIVGDRGKGDTPNSSDGFVPYKSSHLEGAVSELIVNSNHSGHQNPEAIAEVVRILHQHGRR